MTTFHVKHVDNSAVRQVRARHRYTRARRPLLGTGELQDITYTSALLAILTGVIHAGLTPVIQVAGVYPNLALVAVVLVTVVFGFTHGTIWAFAAGLTANLVVSAPLGSLPLTLLVVTVLVAAGDRLLGRLTWVYPVLAAFAASVVADGATLAISRLVGDAVAGGDALALILPAATLNAVLAGILFPFVRLLAGRLGLLEERPAW